MAHILIDWLNNDVQLSKKIGNSFSAPFPLENEASFDLESSQSLANEFATGFLFGEILSSYGLQEDFPQFSTSKSVTRSSRSSFSLVVRLGILFHN